MILTNDVRLKIFADAFAWREN